MYTNILIIRTSAPLEKTEDCDEMALLAKLFKSQQPPASRTNKLFYLYDVDTATVMKSDTTFQQFRLKVAELDSRERGRDVQYITFEKFYFEAKRV